MHVGLPKTASLNQFSKVDSRGYELTVLMYILWFEAKDGTILAPSDEAFEKVDKERLDFIIGNDYLRAEMLGLHFVRERITSTDRKIQGSDDMVIIVSFIP